MKQWILRLKIFFNERYYPIPYLIAAIINSIAIFTIAQLRLPSTDSKLASMALIAFNTFVFPLVMRICDEYKDLESDLIHFPERCIPRGAVRFSDLKILGSILLILFIIFNGVYSFMVAKSLWPMVGLLIYLYAFLKYFFFPKQVSENLILALVLSNPITYFLALYNLYLFIPNFKFNLDTLLISVLFWVPSWIWEIARKIKIKEDETTYQTYSRYMGIPMSCLTPAFGSLIMALILIYFTQSLFWRDVYLALGSLLTLSYIVYMAYFIYNPSRKQSGQIQKVTELVLFIFVLLEVTLFFAK